jgi:hypothetical protein
MSEQLTLDLEYHMSDHYTVELRRGEVGNMEVVRSNTAKTADGALNLIEGFRDSTLQRDGVTWQHDEVDPSGNLYGMAGTVVWQISVVPSLTESIDA